MSVAQYRAERKQGLAKMRARTHSQMWRVSKITGARKKVHGAGATLGPMGSFGDNVILELDINRALLKTLQKYKVPITAGKLLNLARTQVLMPVKTKILEDINKWVPRDTGKLRNSMRNAVRSSPISTFPVRLVINTRGVDYAKPVNRMPQIWLRHAKDPQARKGWFNLVLLDGRNLAKKKFPQLVSHTATLLPRKFIKTIFPRRTLYNVARSLYKFKVS